MKMKAKYIIVLAALCGATAAGVGLTTNIAGLFFTPVAEDFGIGRGSVSVTMTICNLAFAAGGILLGRIINEDRFGKIMRTAVAVTVLSTALLAVCPNVYMMYVLNAVRGVSTGLTGVVMTSMVVNNWFHSNNGTMTSIVMGFSGLASAVFSPLFSAIIASAGWRQAYIISAVLMAVLFLPLLTARIGFTPASAGEIPFGEKSEETVSPAESKDTVKPGRIVVIAAMLYAASGGCLTAVVQHFPGIADSYGLAGAVGAAMLSASMVANTGGKLLLGVLIDRIGVKKGVLMVLAAVTAGVLLLMLTRGSITMIAGAALIGLAYSVATVGVVMTVRETFGTANYGSVYPMCSMCTTVAYAVGAALIGFIYDAVKSYAVIFWLMLGFILLGLICQLYIQNINKRTA
ncbi:MAG: MFS transporter [Solobacterium sp.]|nr:MFS transporter [Solobacterium sp.]